MIFTAVTLAIGVATWSFSALKFQADMGLLLTFMFMINMIMAVTMLPALAVVIDLLRSAPRRDPGAFDQPLRERRCCGGQRSGRSG